MLARQRFRPPPIDMSPFVSVSLMLIVFFVWLKTIAWKQVININAPGGILCSRERFVPKATLYLLGDDKVGCLFYKPDSVSAEFFETNYSANGIRCILTERLKAQHSVVVITPSAESTLKNLVDLLDEIHTHGRINYLLNEYFTLKDKRLIDKYINNTKSAAPLPEPRFCLIAM